MNRKENMMVDMDDVICSGGFLYLINEFLGTNYVAEDAKQYYLQSLVPNELKEDFFNYFKKFNLYDYTSFEPYAIEVLKDLNTYYNICIGTSFIIPEIIEDSGMLLLYKYKYLLEKVPFINPNNFIFLGNKSFLNCEIKIDDKIENLEGACIKWLYESYHNKGIDINYLNRNGIVMVKGWLDIKERALKRVSR